MIEKYIDRQYEYLMGLDEDKPQKPKKKFPFWVVAVLLLAVAIIYFSSCNSQKHIQETKVVLDSSFEKELKDSIRYFRNEKERLEHTINELQYAGVKFDTVFLEGKRDTIINTVTITKEGEIKASGHISAAYVSKSVLTKIVNEKQLTIDSLSKSLEIEKKNIKTVVQVKEVEKKTKPGLPWAMLLVVFAFGCFAWEKSKPFILKILNLEEQKD